MFSNWADRLVFAYNSTKYTISEVFKLILISNLWYLSVQKSVTLLYFPVLCQVVVLIEYVSKYCFHLDISTMCLLRIQPWMRPTEVYLLKLCVPLRRFSSGEIRMTAECLSKISLTLTFADTVIMYMYSTYCNNLIYNNNTVILS